MTLTIGQAEALGERILAAIDAAPGVCSPDEYAADRERVASDLEGLRDHRPHGAVEGCCARCQRTFGWPCHDARRYTDGLLRTARLYGIEADTPTTTKG